MRGNVTFLILIGIAALITALFLLPYLRDIGHPGIAVVIFVFLGVLVFYGRQNPAPKPKSRP
jgi:hypothetical protein